MKNVGIAGAEGIRLEHQVRYGRKEGRKEELWNCICEIVAIAIPSAAKSLEDNCSASSS